MAGFHLYLVLRFSLHAESRIVSLQSASLTNSPKPEVPSSSCRKWDKDESATFFEKPKKHLDEHMTCFKTTMNKPKQIHEIKDLLPTARRRDARSVTMMRSKWNYLMELRFELFWI
ncbi:unnamed protein product [Arabidopsis lyrata]|uniref:Uncharacterized protein n=1 Tax=Arabidopsis lyrata subsp. lyrata TaxID=81972 RepID=D7KYQ6_ARALL|nr:hypothetical protein ARALYDRAFT_893778 [Arabidopsis lyrata subsp. lyrata]CAH8256842.1 unnamed protein product [Arabidopsis lyrata]